MATDPGCFKPTGAEQQCSARGRSGSSIANKTSALEIPAKTLAVALRLVH